MILPPVVISNRSNTFSRRRQLCINKASNPKASANRPNHNKCEWIRLNSIHKVLKYLARLGTSIFIICSMLSQYPKPCPKLQIPHTLSAIYTYCLKSFVSTSFSSPRCTKPIFGIASTTTSSSKTRSK